MCKEKILVGLSGAAVYDAIMHLANAFGVNWVYNLDKTLSLVGFALATIVAIGLWYLAKKYTK